MAYNDDQNEYPVPGSSNAKRTSASLLPRYFRTNANLSSKMFIRSVSKTRKKELVLSSSDFSSDSASTPNSSCDSNYPLASRDSGRSCRPCHEKSSSSFVKSSFKLYRAIKLIRTITWQRVWLQTSLLVDVVELDESQAVR